MDLKEDKKGLRIGIVPKGTGAGGAGDMLKSTYDTDANGVVDQAEKLNDGINLVTAADAKDSVDKKHSHLNKATLDLIEEALTSALKTAYDTAVTKAHEHSNKAVLDLIEEALTSALKTAYDNAVTKAHAHANKATLDLIEEAFTTTLKNKLDGIESGAVALATVKSDSDISDAISKKHSHDNKTILDAIEQSFTTALKNKLDGIETGAEKLSNHTTDDLAEGLTNKYFNGKTEDDLPAGITNKKYTNTEKTKLAGIEESATADQTDVEIQTAAKADTDIADAISKKHEQNKDQYLDQGGANQVVVADVKDSVDKKHTQGTDQKIDDGGVSETSAAEIRDSVDKKHTQGTDQKLDEGGANEVGVADIKDAVDKKHDRSHSIVDSSDHSDKADYIDAPLSPTILTGGVISGGTNAGTFKVSALTALLRTDTTDVATLIKITLAEQDNEAITLADTEYSVVLEYNSGTPRIEISTSRSNGQTNLDIGKVMREVDNTIHYLNSGNRLQSGVHRLHKRASELRRTEISTGFQIADEGSKKFSIASGIMYRGINRFSFSLFDTSASPTPDKFTYVYYNFNTSSWVYVADQTDINVDQYNLISSGDGLASCNKFKCDWVFIHPDDGHVYVVYGQDNDKKADIQITAVPNVPDLIDKFGVLIGRIIIEGGEAVFDEIQMIETTAFRSKTVTDHNDLSGLQGGAADEYYHLTAAEETAATRDATNAQNGLMPSGVKDGYDDAVSKKHDQNTDAHLGTVDQDISLNTHKLTNLSVPDANGQTVRTTTKITEVNLEDAVDKKHTQNSDTDLDVTFEATFVKKVDTVNVLSDITSSGADIEDAVTKKHEHSNKTELDKVTDGDHDVRVDNPHSVTKAQVGLTDVPDLDTTNAVSKAHDRQHNIDAAADHNGVGGAVEDNFVAFNASGLPKDSGKKDSDYSDKYTQSEVDNLTGIDDFTIERESNKLKLANRIEQNIILNAFRIAVNGSLAAFNMVKGLLDEFEDESGVDTGLSVNEDYDAVNDLYEPSVTAATELDYMEYATDGAAQAAYVSSDADVVPTSEYSSDANTQLLLHCNGLDTSTTIPDSGNTNHGNAIVVGNAQLDTAQKKFGTASLLLDGTGDYITYVDHADWNFGSGNFTIDFRVRFAAVSDSMGICGQYVDVNNYWKIFYYHDSSKLYFECKSGGAYIPSYGTAWTPSVDTWYHIAVIGDGTNVHYYIDGVELGAGTSIGTMPDLMSVLEIGYVSNEARTIHWYMNGWIDEFRISKGIARWTSDFNVPNLQSYSESSIKSQGSYSLKGIAVITNSLNDTLTKSGLSIDLSGKNTLKYDIYSASRTGSQIKIGIHDSGGTTTEHTANISSTGSWETQTWDISGVADANKDNIDSIIITIVNADAANTFYVDNFYAPGVTNNMTLISETVTAEAQPSNARLVLFEEDIDAITENTDLKVYVSRDNRVTYSQVTLVDEGDYGSSKRLLSGLVDISGQPAGTSMIWKVTTHNAKELKVHGIGVVWD